MIRRITLAAALLAGAALPASAQMPSYCEGHLTATALYATIQSDGRTAIVSYHAQVQNQDPRRRTITATIGPQPALLGGFTVTRIIGSFQLASYQQKAINLLSLRVNNPAGRGAPSALDVGREIRIRCGYG